MYTVVKLEDEAHEGDINPRFARLIYLFRLFALPTGDLNRLSEAQILD